MKRLVLALAAVFALVSVAAPPAFAAPDRVLTIEKGKLKILHLAFEPSQGSNSNPVVLGARPDLKRNRLFLVARDVGDAIYVVKDRNGGRRLEVQVRVVEATD